MRHLFLLLSLVLTACGGGLHEGTVTYQVHLKPADVTGSTIAEDQHIDVTDAQWQTFLSQARDALVQPYTEFGVRGVRLQLDATKSRNVSALQDVLSGEVTAFLRASETGSQVDIARVQSPQGSAQLPMALTGKSLHPLEDNLARGDFRLGLRGGTPKAPTSDFEAVLTVTLDVTAR